MLVSLNNPIPIVPIIKSGPELFVKASNLSASSFVQIPWDLKFETIFAPIGYPLIIPIIKGKAPSPGTLNIGLINLFKSFPKIEITFVYPRSSVAMKKGSREGTTEFAHKASPVFADDKFAFENINKNRVNKHIHIEIKDFFILNTKNFILCMDTPLDTIYINLLQIYVIILLQMM